MLVWLEIIACLLYWDAHFVGIQPLIYFMYQDLMVPSENLQRAELGCFSHATRRLRMDRIGWLTYCTAFRNDRKNFKIVSCCIYSLFNFCSIPKLQPYWQRHRPTLQCFVHHWTFLKHPINVYYGGVFFMSRTMCYA